MARKHKIRWQESDSEELKRAVRNFNSKLDWAMPFQRTGKFPLDRSSIFSSYADALKYAGSVTDSSVVTRVRKNNSVILEKMFEASKSAGYKISEEDYVKIKNKCKGFSYGGDIGTGVERK